MGPSMVPSVWQFFTISRGGNCRFAKCNTCNRSFSRWGTKSRSFYTKILINHLRSCHQDHDVLTGYQETRLLRKRKKRVKYEENDTEESEDIDPDSSPTPNKEQENGLWTVTCGDKTGLLDVSKLRRSMDCIKCDGQWFTPPAFEDFAGKRSYKKWKASIFYKNQPLQYWFEQGYLSTKGFKRQSQECVGVTSPLQASVDLLSDSTSEHLSDGNSAATASISVTGAAGGPDCLHLNDSWCQPLDFDLLMEEDRLSTHDPPSPAAEDLNCSLVQDVAREVELTYSPEREDSELEDIQDDTGSQTSTPATTASDVAERKDTMTSQSIQVENEKTDRMQMPELSIAWDLEFPPAPSPPPSPSFDLDAIDLDQLKREKLKMQIKVLRLQEEYYIRTLGGTL